MSGALYIWLSACLLASAGLVEWLRQLAIASDLTPANEGRGLLGVLVVYAAIGAATGLATVRWTAPAERAVRAFGACAAVAGALFVLGRFGATPRAVVPAAATAWVAYALATRAARHLPALASPLLWSLVLAIGTLVLFARSLWAAGQGREIATALAATAAAVLFLGAAFALARRWPGRAVGACALSVLSVALASAWLGFRVPVARPSGTPPPGAPSVLLVTIDTLRADHLGAYGYGRADTPHLDGLAREGALFREAVSSTFYTGPSHTTILTGLDPHRHGSEYNGDKLGPEVRTAAEWFGSHGYATGAFVSGWPTTDRASRLPSRFHDWDDDLREFRLLPRTTYLVPALALLHPIVEAHTPRNDGIDRPAVQVVDSALAWIEANRGRPFFVWVHLYDPHLPYQPPPSYLPEGGLDGDEGPVDGLWYGLPEEKRTAIVSSPENVARMLALYDAEIAYTDTQVGRLLETLQKWLPADDLLTVVTADHGESMGEHGIYWARDLFDDTLLVPLLIAGRGVEPGRVISTPVRLVDVLPTMLELAALPAPEAIDGQSLVPLLRGDEAPMPLPALSALYKRRPGLPRDAFSLRQGGWKLIERREGWDEIFAIRVGESVELYDLRNDPRELHDVAAREPEKVRALRAQLDAATKEQSEAPHDPLSEEDREALRALGYVQ